jgi:hypothetical protein
VCCLLQIGEGDGVGGGSSSVNDSAITEVFGCTYFFILKVPKCENFDRWDFHDFHKIKSFWVGDFVVIIKINYLNFWGS